MRALRLAGLGAVTLSLVLGAYACGSNSLQDGDVPDGGLATTDGTVPTTDGAGNDGTAPGTDSGGGGDTGSPGDTGAPGDSNAPDVAFDAKSTPDGGSASDPTHVGCANTTCGVPANECCIQSDAGGVCKPSNGACPGNTIGPLKCDEAANCADGSVCCVTPSLAGVSSACSATACGIAQPQLCRTNGECPNHNCTPQTCTFNGTKVHIEACGLQAAAGCTSP